MSRIWLDNQSPPRGEVLTPFLRIKPSRTGVTWMPEAPMSITRAEALPVEKLGNVRILRLD